MTPSGKLLKITSLVGMFVGLASLILGAVIAFGDVADIDAWATVFDGVLATVYGVRTAILANVPSNTSKIRTKAFILLAAGAAVAAYLILGGRDVQMAQTCLAGFIAGLALVAIIIATRIVKEQLRK